MSSLLRKRGGAKIKEMPFELKYNCVRHLNDELLKRLADANQLIEHFRELLNGRTQEETVSYQQEGCQIGDGLCLECRGEDAKESIPEATSDQEAQDDQRIIKRNRIWDCYEEGEWK
jgi:hypothetical protein